MEKSKEDQLNKVLGIVCEETLIPIEDILGRCNEAAAVDARNYAINMLRNREWTINEISEGLNKYRGTIRKAIKSKTVQPFIIALIKRKFKSMPTNKALMELIDTGICIDDICIAKGWPLSTVSRLKNLNSKTYNRKVHRCQTVKEQDIQQLILTSLGEEKINTKIDKSTGYTRSMRTGIYIAKDKKSYFWRANCGEKVYKYTSRSGSKTGLFKGAPTGTADILGVVHGVAVALEVKRNERSKQTPGQIEWQKIHEMAGGVYVVVRSVEEAKQVVRNIVKGDSQ